MASAGTIRISLNKPPEFYTNLDVIEGRVILNTTRIEQIGLVIVKLEGEANTALSLHLEDANNSHNAGSAPGDLSEERHKILYQVQQVFPGEDAGPAEQGPVWLRPGQYTYPFRFKLPFNNACSSPNISRIGGVTGAGGFGSGGGLFGLGGIRVMDGSKQLFLHHVTKTLPPSFTGFPGVAEIRYYLKVTLQRPGLLKENWRYQIGFKFMPIEPPRPAVTAQEAFAQRPFNFQPRARGPQKQQQRKGSFFGIKSSSASASTTPTDDKSNPDEAPPNVQLSARLPYPSILTCNEPLPLRLIVKKLTASPGQAFIISLQIDLIGTTQVRAHDLYREEKTRYVIVSEPSGLCIPLTAGTDHVGTELVLPDDAWKSVPLPRNVTPSFIACNVSRAYELEIKLGISWGRPPAGNLFSRKGPAAQAGPDLPQTVFLPLHFAKIQVFSGIRPPPALLDLIAAQANRPSQPTLDIPAPRLPPRRPSGETPAAAAPPARPSNAAAAAAAAPPAYDPLYPPQLAGSGPAPADDAPPSYDEAMAEDVAGPFDGSRPRPAFSGVTNENAPSIPEKR